MDDRRTVYDWLANSDLTASMLGEPKFPDEPVPSWEEFCEDHTLHFFEEEITEQGRCFIMQVGGEDLGQIYFNDIETKNGIKRVELDMWMRAEKFCGKGYGTDALNTLCDFLAQQFGVEQFMVQPSARNPRAMRAYEKAGFVKLAVPLEEAVKEWGPNDYFDSVHMVKTIKKSRSS
jgi:diamine N-acetyltransferase